MKRLLPLLLLFALPVFGQAPIRVVSNLAALDGWYPSIGQPAVSVLGHTTPGDWGPAREFRWDSTNALATNAVRRATVTGVGRWVHDWDGDASVFVLPSTNDCGPVLTSASDYAASVGKALVVAVPGDYHLTTTNGLRLTSNARVRFGQGVWLVGNYDAQTGGFPDPAKAFVRNSGLTGWPADGELSVVNTNITIEGLRLRANDSGDISYGICMFGVEGLRLDNIEVADLHSAWAFNIAANDVLATSIKIRTAGAVYQDGVHIIGGSRQVWQNLDIHSGDDAIAVSGINSVPIRDIVIQGATVRSQFAHAVRLNQEYAENTNLFERITFADIAGFSGQERNGQVRVSSESTNVARPFRDITIRNVKVVGRSSGPPAIGVDYGFYIKDAESITLDDCWSGETVYQNLWATNCGTVLVDKFYGVGSRGTAFNQTARFSMLDRLKVANSTFLTTLTTTNTGLPIFLEGVGSAIIEGNFIVPLSTTQNGIQLDRAVSTNVVVTGNTFVFSSGNLNPVYCATNPVNLVVSGNIANSTNLVSYAGSSSGTEVIFGNRTLNAGAGGNNAYLPGKLELAANVTDYLLRLNRVGIGTAEFSLNGNRLTMVPSSGNVVFSDSLAAGTTKTTRIGLTAYEGSQNPVALLYGQSTSGNNSVVLGGGHSSYQAARAVSIYGASTTNIATGTELAQFNGTVSASDNSTPMFLLHSNTLRRVYATNISGIPNVLYVP